jgi:hypothetical protein
MKKVKILKFAFIEDLALQCKQHLEWKTEYVHVHPPPRVSSSPNVD